MLRPPDGGWLYIRCNGRALRRRVAVALQGMDGRGRRCRRRGRAATKSCPLKRVNRRLPPIASRLAEHQVHPGPPAHCHVWRLLIRPECEVERSEGDEFSNV